MTSQRCRHLFTETELDEGAILGLFDMELFVPWCQVNALLTRPKKDSYLCRVIMDLSWPHPPSISVNGCTHMDRYIGECKKTSLLSSKTQARAAICTDVTSPGHTGNSPWYSADWPLVCLQVQGRYLVDISLPFGLRWAAACCQDTTSFITCAFREQGGTVLNYIDDFGGIASQS